MTGSSISGNASTTGKSVGILLSKAAGEGAGVKVSGSYIGANKGFGLWNGDAGLTTPSTTAVIASGNYWGTNGTPAEGETVLGPPDVEGVSGAGSVTFNPVAGAKPVVAGGAGRAARRGSGRSDRRSRSAAKPSNRAKRSNRWCSPKTTTASIPSP